MGTFGEHYPCTLDCLVAERLHQEVILGLDWLQREDPLVSWRDLTVTFPRAGFSGAPVGAGEPCMPVTVRASPKQSNVSVHVCALKTVLHSIRSDNTACAWVAYVRPFVGSTEVGEAAVQSEIATLCDEF